MTDNTEIFIYSIAYNSSFSFSLLHSIPLYFIYHSLCISSTINGNLGYYILELLQIMLLCTVFEGFLVHIYTFLLGIYQEVK